GWGGGGGGGRAPPPPRGGGGGGGGGPPLLLIRADDPLKAARQRLQRGNYAEARELYAKLGPEHPSAAVGIAAAWRAEGEAGKALDAIDRSLKPAPTQTDLLAHRADLFLSLGKWDDARKDAEAALAKDPKHFLARWVRAQLLRDSGDLQTADAEVRWFVREYTEAADADKEITDPDLLLIVGQAGAENATWNNRPQQFQFILNEVYRDALKRDPDCWQAEYQAGRLLLEKHSRGDALNAFDAALAINPKAADALVGKGLVALDGLDLKDAERFAEQALKVNPRHPGALRLKADVLLTGGDLGAAERLLTAARLVNPRDEATLARLAAVYHLMGKGAEVAARAKEVEGFDPKPARFYHDLGTVLEDQKQFPKAEEYFRKAAGLRPNVPGPAGDLGMLLLRTGREAEARPLLDAAKKADPFNVRVSNSLRVLKHLDGYQTVETPHYVVRFDPKADALLAPFLADYLEEVHAEFKGRYGYEPPGKVLIEVFSSREMFSGRTIALPTLPDVAAGACSGRVVSFPSPTAKKGPPENWARVIRHELTHAFNLLQTDYRVPHWLTEGLAVRTEGEARPPQWVAVLRQRHAAGTMLDLDNITLAFVRPRAPDDWPLAYLQALLYVEYTVQTYGEGSVGKLLDAYRTTADTAAVLKQALGADKAEFERGYRKYVDGVVKGAGRRGEKPLTFAELEAAYKASPDDADLMARLAGEYARRNKADEARKLVDTALAKEKGHPGASVVKARLLDRDKDPAGARAVLEEAAKENPDDPRVLLALGRQLTGAKELEAAAAAFERGRKAAPHEAEWLPELARLYNTLDRSAELVGVLAEIAARDPDERPARVKLARLLLPTKPEEAERIAWEALRLDLRDADARAVLLEALKARGKDGEAAKLAKRFE
ncbi:MAG: tetratricopeptide repeat protein, partial [Gemmataceae bacterium]|nr:tetratricopeptide repeat protein [Gemmataceae bacterium]